MVRRLFVGLRPPIEVARTCLGALDWPDRAHWRRVAVEKFHLTLVFLGNIDSAAVPRIEQALRTTCAAHFAFPLEIRGHGAFPSEDRARVAWAGVSPASAYLLEDLVKSITRDLRHEQVEWSEESRSFQPHFTMARSRRSRSVVLPDAALESCSFIADEVILFESREGQYEVLSTFRLATARP